jgi:hypothetical protein
MLTWSSEAVVRLGDGLRWCRQLGMERDGVTVVDRLRNSLGRPMVLENFVHWAPGWELTGLATDVANSRCWLAQTPARCYHVKITNACPGTQRWRVEVSDNWHCLAYGQKVAARTLCITCEAKTDIMLRWQIQRS